MDPEPERHAAPYQTTAAAGQGRAIRERARQALADGDIATARTVLRQLLVDAAAGELSDLMTEALVATATAHDAEQARERYGRTQRELQGFLAWLDTADLDQEDLRRLTQHVQRKMDHLERQAAERRAEEQAPGGPDRRRRVGSGWLEAKLIPKPNGRLNGPYLYFRARAAGHRRSIYLGKLTPGREPSPRR
jgi:hypothetical protein